MSGSIFLDSSEYSVRENEGSVTVVVRRTGDTSSPVSVQYSTNPDSADATADYLTRSGTIVIGAGETFARIEVPIVNDGAGEPSETFNLSLIKVSSGTLLFPRTTNVTILDDENPIQDPVSPPFSSEYTLTSTPAVNGLSVPLGLEWIEGRGLQAIAIEKEGRLQVVDTSTGQKLGQLLDITAEVNSTGDRGLLDIALHPDLANNPYLYAFYTVDPPQSATASGLAGLDGAGNRYAHVVRWELDLSGATPSIVAGSKTIIAGAAGKSLADISGGGALDFTDQANSALRASEVDPATGEYRKDYIKVDSLSHAGGALAFGPDGMLYISIGDGTSYNYADPRTVSVQSVDSLSGKILRVDPITGLGLADNPHATADLSDNASKVWQMGLRNPYSMTFSEDGRLFISNTGWFSAEEIESGGKGANFGWPYYEGGDAGVLDKTPVYSQFATADAFFRAVENGDIVVTPAFRSFSHLDADPGYRMSAIVGANDVYTGDKYPAELRGDYFFTDVTTSDMFAVDVNDRSKLIYLGKSGTAPVAFMQGPDGFMYYSDLATGQINRIQIVDPTPEPNRAPVVASALPFVSAEPGKAFSFSVPPAAFFDADGDRLVFAARLADGSPLPSWLSFDATMARFTGTPPAGAAAKLAISVTASDASGAVAEDIFEFSVAAKDPAPVLASPASNVNAAEGTAFEYTLPASMFTDNGAISLSAQLSSGAPLPSWLTFDPAAGRFAGTPPQNAEGKLVVTVTATDGSGNKTSDSFAIEIAGTNAAPVVSGTAPQPVAETGAPINFALAPGLFTDPDGDALTLTATLADGSPLPSWLSFDAATRFFTGSAPAAGDVDIRITATDPAQASASVSFTLKVSAPPAPNTAPIVAAPLADVVIAEGAALSFSVPPGTFTDPDGDAIVLSATLAGGATLPAWLSFDAATGTFSGRPDDPQVGSIQVAVRALDARGLSVTDTFSLEVTPVNDAPILAAPIADKTAAQGQAFAFTVPATTFTDADDAVLTYAATRADGTALPGWLSFDAATLSFTGTPAAGDAGSVTVRLTARDAGGLSANDEFAIAVSGGNPVETAYANNPGEIQYLTGVAERDVFVIAAPSRGFGWAKTEDGLGIVVWNSTSHDLLYGFEAIRFSDVTVELVSEDVIVRDIAGVTQFEYGKSDNDVFRIDGLSTGYGWGATQDGTGFVVWTGTDHDILFGFEQIQFDDATIDLAQAGG